MTGDLILSNYKLPLKAVEKGEGFGYMGALSTTKDGGLIQCHICGRLFQGLGLHLAKGHGITADEYREKFQLARQTALVSETMREQMKSRLLLMLSKRTAEENKKQRDAAIIKAQEAGHTSKHRLETKNKNGRCPDQLLQTIKDFKEYLGRAPSSNEYRNYDKRHASLFVSICATFGTWNNAMKLAIGEIHPRQMTGKWTDEMLLNHLKVFWETHKTIPTKSDARRGFIPSVETYQAHFGGIVRARSLAGLPNVNLTGFAASLPRGKSGHLQSHSAAEVPI